MKNRTMAIWIFSLLLTGLNARCINIDFFGCKATAAGTYEAICKYHYESKIDNNGNCLFLSKKEKVHVEKRVKKVFAECMQACENR